MAFGKYRWDDWFGMGRFTLLRGRDYACEQMSMAQQVRNAAARRGFRISVHAVPGGLLVQVTNAPEPAETGGER